MISRGSSGLNGCVGPTEVVARPELFPALRRRWRGFRPPLVRQNEQSDCGPAALLSVLQFWGGDESLAAVRDLSGTDARGSTLLGLCDAAEALGLSARGAQGGFDELMHEVMPCIAHLVLKDGRTHFVVLNRVAEDRVWIGDPVRGRRSCSRDDFEAAWKTGSVLLLYPRERVRRCPPAGWVTWLSGYVRREPVWLVQSLFLGVVATALSLLTAVFIERLIDRYIPERNIPMILGTGSALRVVLLTTGVSRYLRQRFLIRLNRIVSSDVNEDFLSHLYRLPLRFFESRAIGDITTRIADGLRIQQGLLQIGGAAVIDGLLVVGSALFLFLIAPPLGVIALISVPLYTAILLRAATGLREEQSAALSAYGQGRGRIHGQHEGDFRRSGLRRFFIFCADQRRVASPLQRAGGTAWENPCWSHAIFRAGRRDPDDHRAHLGSAPCGG